MKSLLKKCAELNQLWSRVDIDSREKWYVAFQFLSLAFRSQFNASKTMRFAGYRISTQSRTNLKGILKEVFLSGDYVVRIDKRDPIIFDCGGNIGVSTLFFKRYYPESRVTVFEPSPENFALLERNVSQNKLTDVTLVKAALAATPGKVSFWYDPMNPGGSTSTEAVQLSKSSSSRTPNRFMELTVEAQTLSSYISGPVDLIKMDIEGGEGEVLRELAQTGKLSFVKEIILEYHLNPTNKKNALPPFLSLLESSGFKFIIFDSGSGVPSEWIKRQPSSHFMVRAFRE